MQSINQGIPYEKIYVILIEYRYYNVQSVEILCIGSHQNGLYVFLQINTFIRKIDNNNNIPELYTCQFVIHFVKMVIAVKLPIG